MKTAIEQRASTLNSIDHNKALNLQMVYCEIEQASEYGRFEISIQRNIYDETIKTLKDLGYRVVPFESGWCVSW